MSRHFGRTISSSYSSPGVGVAVVPASTTVSSPDEGVASSPIPDNCIVQATCLWRRCIESHWIQLIAEVRPLYLHVLKLSHALNVAVTLVGPISTPDMLTAVREMCVKTKTLGYMCMLLNNFFQSTVGSSPHSGAGVGSIRQRAVSPRTLGPKRSIDARSWPLSVDSTAVFRIS